MFVILRLLTSTSLMLTKKNPKIAMQKDIKRAKYFISNRMKKRFVFGLFLVALVLLSCAPQNDSVGQASQLRNPDGQTSSSPRPLRVGETVYLKQYVPNPDRNEYDPSREMWVPYIVTRRYELSGDPMVLSVDFDAVQQLAFPGI